MSIVDDHAKIGTVLASYGRACEASAHHHEEAAEGARARKKSEMGRHINAPAEARGRMEGVYDAEIAKHDRAARAHRRRADFAASGMLYHGPDESGDAEYMKTHQELVNMAQRAGRIHHGERSPD
jgi:hypothetical protein